MPAPSLPLTPAKRVESLEAALRDAVAAKLRLERALRARGLPVPAHQPTLAELFARYPQLGLGVGALGASLAVAAELETTAAPDTDPAPVPQDLQALIARIVRLLLELIAAKASTIT